MKKTIFTGVGTAIVTPMNADGSINYDEFGKLLDFQVENGADATEHAADCMSNILLKNV